MIEQSRCRSAAAAKEYEPPFRRRIHRALASALGVAVLMLFSAAAGAQAPAPGAKPSTGTRIVKGRILVQPKAGLSSTEFDQIIRAHGARRLQHLRQINVHVIELPSQANEMAVVNAPVRPAVSTVRTL